MGVEIVSEHVAPTEGCPRISASGRAEDPFFKCPALALVDDDSGSEEFLKNSVNALLGCRAFLWDVLMDGEWTACARERLRELTELYGSEKVGKAFEE